MTNKPTSKVIADLRYFRWVYNDELEDAIQNAADRLAELEAALSWYVQFEKLEGEDSIERFERVAEIFRKETGYLRPGKDCILHDPEVRQKAWEEWVLKNVSKAKQALQPKEAKDA